MSDTTKKMVYQKVPTDLNFVEREKKVEVFWAENKIFEKSIELRAQGDSYVFYDGPPTANGKPHIGHVLTRVIKDMIPRYRTMKGFKVPRKAGWDTHGLPVELEVEKQIKLRLNGVEKTVAAIEKAGHNYVRLQDLRDGHIRVDYDAKAGEPVVTVVPGESKKI